MEIWSSIESANVLADFASRLNKLRTTPYSILKELPEFVNDSVIIDYREVTFTTYRNETENEDIEIVLQVSIRAGKRRLFSSGQVSADGFRVSPDDKIKTIDPKALYYYM